MLNSRKSNFATEPDRVHASGVTNADQALGPQDTLLLKIDTDARHGHGLVCESICLEMAGVNMAIPLHEWERI
jgi:hypothetical protein